LDLNEERDVFVHDMQTGATTLVSLSTEGFQSSNASKNPSISATGRYVSFDTTGPLGAGDTNGAADVFVRDRLLGTTTRVSVSTAGTQGCCTSDSARLSTTGRFVVFASAADDLV